MSKRFSFRLDGLHRFRKYKTNEAKLALGEIARLRFEKERTIEQRQDYLDNLETKRRTLRAMELQMNMAHIESIRLEIKSLKAELVNLVEIESMRRQELTHTMRDEKVLDNLRDKRLVEYNHTILLEEQTLMDEIAARTDGEAKRA